MGKIVLEVEEFGKTHSEYRVFDQDCVRIGRAFHNDVIVNDPFVAAAHLSLKFSEGGWECENNPSINGTFISKAGDRAKVKMDNVHPVHSGDTIFLGKTIIHVWDVHHEVGSEQALDGGSALPSDHRRTFLNAVYALGGFLFIFCLYLSQSVWKKNNAFFQTLCGVVLVFLCLAAWSGMWALITRFSKRQNRFLQHLIFSLQWAVLAVSLSCVFKYVAFFVCHSVFDNIASLIIFALSTLYVLDVHLAIGTNLSAKKRLSVSGSIAFAVVLLAGLGYSATRNEFNPKPDHYIGIVFVPKKAIPAVPINEELDRIDRLF